VVPGSAVINVNSGPVPADVMFIGEAPGRRGAAVTGVPFDGDESGRRFTRLLAEAGLRRDDVFVTNAVLCLPLDASGRNRPPSRHERTNCGAHLAATIALVRPRLIVTLGATALAALRHLEPHNFALCNVAATALSWHGITVFPLYHTSQRAQVHRSWDQQVEDWRRLGEVAAALHSDVPSRRYFDTPLRAAPSRRAP
jgi:DNA polymerase